MPTKTPTGKQVRLSLDVGQNWPIVSPLISITPQMSLTHEQVKSLMVALSQLETLLNPLLIEFWKDTLREQCLILKGARHGKSKI